MAVLPINSVSVNANQYTFTGKKDKNSHKANPLASVPVIVMLTMAPMVEGKQPAQFVPIDSEHLTEVLAQANSVAPKAYEYTQSQEKEAPLGVEYFKRRPIAHIQTGTNGVGKTAHIVFCPVSEGSENLKKIISAIYYVDDDVVKYSTNNPPIITGLVYHDIGKDKEFCSLKMIHTRYDKNGEMIRHLVHERIDDKTAQLLIDFLAGETKWKNSTNIKFYVSDGIRLPSPELLDQD